MQKPTETTPATGVEYQRITLPYTVGMNAPEGYTFGGSRIYRDKAGRNFIEFSRVAPTTGRLDRKALIGLIREAYIEGACEQTNEIVRYERALLALDAFATIHVGGSVSDILMTLTQLASGDPLGASYRKGEDIAQVDRVMGALLEATLEFDTPSPEQFIDAWELTPLYDDEMATVHMQAYGYAAREFLRSVAEVVADSVFFRP